MTDSNNHYRVRLAVILDVMMVVAFFALIAFLAAKVAK
jgi:hypothetical protein